MQKFKNLLHAGKTVLFIGVFIALLFPCAVASAQTYTKQETITVPYSTKTIEDDTRFNDEKEIITQGVNGSRDVTYEVRKSFGVETSKRIVSDTTTTEAIEQVEKIGIVAKTITFETEQIPYEEKTVYDYNIYTGQTKVTQHGKNGERVKAYEVHTIKGVERSKELINETVTVEPTPQITSIGTHEYSQPQQSSARSGAICSDGWRSSATGRGACSHHGGVSQWTY